MPDTKVVHVIKHSDSRDEESDQKVNESKSADALSSIVDDKMSKYLSSITDMCLQIQTKVEGVSENLKHLESRVDHIDSNKVKVNTLQNSQNQSPA